MRIFKCSILILCMVILCSCKAEGELIKINYSYESCFGAGREELTVYRSGNITKARLKLRDKNLFSNVTKDQLDSIYFFVEKVKNLKEDGYCTLKGSYSVSANEEIFYREYESCVIQGISSVTLMLFNNEDIYH